MYFKFAARYAQLALKVTFSPLKSNQDFDEIVNQSEKKTKYADFSGEGIWGIRGIASMRAK